MNPFVIAVILNNLIGLTFTYHSKAVASFILSSPYIQSLCINLCLLRTCLLRICTRRITKEQKIITDISHCNSRFNLGPGITFLNHQSDSMDWKTTHTFSLFIRFFSDINRLINIGKTLSFKFRISASRGLFLCLLTLNFLFFNLNNIKTGNVLIKSICNTYFGFV